MTTNSLTLNIVTMTSLELVELINSQRKEDEATLAHSDFLKKVPIVLGESVAGNFSCYYTALNGKQNRCYNFPKREACLMAMSYSYDLQAKVFDRMTELEAEKAKSLLPDFSNPAVAARAWADEVEKRQKTEQENVKLLPDAELCKELVENCETTYLIDTVAGMVPMKPSKLRDYLKAEGWLKYSDGTWLPAQKVRDLGWMVVRVDQVSPTRAYPCPAFTMRGVGQLRHTLSLGDLFKHVPVGLEIFRDGKIKVLQHEHPVTQ